MEDDGSITVSADDDLMTRAEKIVHVMGMRGAVGGFVINVYRVLQAYEREDREKAELNQPRGLSADTSLDTREER